MENTLEDLLEEEFNTEVDSVINYTLKQQAKLFNDLKKEDPKLALKALADMAGTAVSVKRIKTEDANQAADRDAAVSISKALSKYVDDPFKVGNPVKRDAVDIALPTITLVPDETSTVSGTIEFSDIV